jgi:YHYH protein
MFKMNYLEKATCLCALAIAIASCGSSGANLAGDASNNANEASTLTETKATEKAPACNTQIALDIYRRVFMPTVQVFAWDKYIIVQGAMKPPHSSPYFPYGTPGWEPFQKLYWNSFQPGNLINPYKYMQFGFPACPQQNGNLAPTPMGAIGISVAGVPFYNQYAGGGAALDWQEILTFDRWNGHPDPAGTYHYHKEPYWITYVRGSRATLVGYLLDGYPVYGPQEENGSWVSNGVLDSAHGHTHGTREYPYGIYHYHTTDSAPYINGNGFKGIPGWVTGGL